MDGSTNAVVGRYEIVRLLGHGGAASVHLARQPSLDRDVALKVLHGARPGAAPPALAHPNIVTVFEYFEHEGVPCIAMEYLDLGSLRPLVGRLTLAQVAGVLEGMLAALAEASAHGVVHGALKPENVLLGADGRAKVADFGAAGTPAYTAPEQALEQDVGPQADLYATGVIAYELLAGRHPFHGTDAPVAQLQHHVKDRPPPLSDLRPDLQPAIVAWVHGMLAKDPGRRPAGARSAWEALELSIVELLGPHWRRQATPDVRAVAARRRPPLVALVAGGMLVVLLAAFAGLSQGAGPRAVPPFGERLVVEERPAPPIELSGLLSQPGGELPPLAPPEAIPTPTPTPPPIATATPSPTPTAPPVVPPTVTPPPPPDDPVEEIHGIDED
jgi:hypothetical protein